MKRYATIKDIAKELNISTSTVSRALADRWDVKPETRERVLETAKRLNYRPNVLAKNLLSQRTGTIGVIIPEFVNSFFPKVIMGIQDILYQENYRILITQSSESHKEELVNLHLLEDSMVEGIIMSVTRESGNSEEYQRIIDSGIPIVFFNRVCERTEAPKVIIDDRVMAFRAVEHLIQTGYKRIAHFGGPNKLQLTSERRAGYLDALEKYALPVDESLIIETGVLMEKGISAMKGLLEQNSPLPDAIFAFNDPVAIGAMKVTKEAGLKIPEDIALAGFSEDVMATIVEPQLTTVLQPMYEMGKQAAVLLLEQIRASKPVKPKTVCLDAQLNIRSSSVSEK